MSAFLAANLGLRFLLELAVLCAIGLWGFRAGGTLPAQLTLGVGIPLVVAVIWGAFIGPNATTPEAARTVLQIAVLAAGALALAATRSTVLASAFVAVAVINAGLLAVLED